MHVPVDTFIIWRNYDRITFFVVVVVVVLLASVVGEQEKWSNLIMHRYVVHLCVNLGALAR